MATVSTRRDFFRLLTGGAPSRAALTGVPLGGGDLGLHLLNRISYGARPEDLDRLNQIGLGAYLEEQLAPDTLDDPEGEAVVRRYPILSFDRRTLHSLRFDGRVYDSIIEGMVWRAVHSRRQLYERMVEFWTDHFNIPASDLQHDVALMHHTVIRKHAMGKFRDLVLGTAKSPAMLYYLDQTYSSKEHPNENYARELLELHTLGVDGGYSEADVKEAARALTGWTVNDATESGFYFNPEMHDSDAKSVLGHSLPAGRGIEDGLHVIALVVNHPATARFLAHKLCVRFVSDTPPASLVESTAQVWMDNDGEIVPVLRHLFRSAEFMGAGGQKLRRPLDFFIGALRATGTHIRETWRLHDMLNDLAQAPYGWAPPDGYPDTAKAWLSSSGLLARWNVAMMLTHGAYSDREMGGLSNRLDQWVGQAETVGALVDAVALRVFGTTLLPEGERAVFIDYASDGAGESAPATPRVLAERLGMLFGLMLASPLYQWR
ncbi:MAG: DUF1800 domain-containing protein [Anaerolineae bacterium]|nr:DUF1800 domain-containing protein [Anaerolineae bacterium]